MNGTKRENIQPGLNWKTILSYFKLPINNASGESLNNKAKIISRRTYGFRSVRSHILNLYHCLADLPDR
ncbi:MAG: transposase [Pseudomonadota bacterium]